MQVRRRRGVQMKKKAAQKMNNDFVSCSCRFRFHVKEDEVVDVDADVY